MVPLLLHSPKSLFRLAVAGQVMVGIPFIVTTTSTSAPKQVFVAVLLMVYVIVSAVAELLNNMSVMVFAHNPPQLPPPVADVLLGVLYQLNSLETLELRPMLVVPPL